MKYAAEKGKISIIIPVFNEEETLTKLYEEITNTLKKTIQYEIIFVNDGSTDESLAVLKKISSQDDRIKIVSLLSNYGQSNATAAGIEYSEGDVIVTMDSDLQHDPEDILSLIEPLKNGYHVVCGWRKERNASDSLIKKVIPSKISNWLIRSLTNQKLEDSTGGMRAFVRKVVEVIPLYGEMHRYLPILAAWKGFKVTEVPIHIRKRVSGKTKYTYTRIFRGFLDLLTVKFFITYSARPIHIFGMLGMVSLLCGMSITLYFVIQKFILGAHLSNDIPTVLFGFVMILLGILFLGFGFIADMISYDAISSQRRETFIVDSITVSSSSQ